MGLGEYWAALRSSQTEKVILILDASESAVALQQQVLSLAQEVLSALPAGVGRDLYFLGNPSPYPAADLAHHAAQWCAENRRSSMVTPVWEALDADGTAPIVVIGSGHLFDLEDWAETALARRALLVSVGDPLQGGLPIAEELARPAAEELVRRLYDPPVRVEISGPAFMPIEWDQPEYRLQLAGDEALLVAERLADYAVMVHFLAPAEGLPQALLTHASGKRVPVALEPAAAIDTAGGEQGMLRPEEAALLEQAIRREAFTCLHCGRPHPWETRRCLEGVALLGEIVYPTLQARSVAGLVVLRVCGEGARFELPAGNILRLGPAEVVVQEGQAAAILRYDDRSRCWRRMGKALEPYQPIGEDAYVLLF